MTETTHDPTPPMQPPAAVEERSIYQRLNEVRKRIDYVQKDAQVSGAGGGYKAVTHDQVTANVRPHLVEQGIIVVPSLVSERTVETGTSTKNGTPIIRHEAVYDVVFSAGGDAVTVRVASHANDQGDKAPGKALSMAVKYAILKVLSIETGVNEEGRIEDAAPPTITQDQHFQLVLKCEELGFPEPEKTLAALAAAHKLESIMDVRADVFHKVVSALEKRAAQLVESGE